MLAWWLTEVMVIWSGVVKELAGLYNSNFRLVGMGRSTASTSYC